MTAENPDNELIVDLPADTSPIIEVERTKTPEDEGVDALKAQVEEAKRQREADRLGREEADRRAAAAAAEAARAREDANRFRTEASDNRLNAVVTAIDNVSKEAEMAQARFEAAAQNGDYKALALAQREISQAEARLLQLQNNKAALEDEAKNPQQRQTETTPAYTDPVERYVATGRITPRSAEWVRSHRDVVLPDGNVKPEVIRAHWSALGEGLTPDTNEYFAHIDQKLGYGAPQQDRQQPAQVVNIETRRAPVATAPVSREASSEPMSPTRVRLTPEEVEAAEISGLTPQEYARWKMDPKTKEMLANGRR